jgi:hypothetical protein
VYKKNIMHKQKEIAVLNVIQAAAADSVLSGGKWKLNDGTDDLISEIKIVDGTSFTQTAYAAGTVSVKDVDFAGHPLLALSQYRLAVEIPGRVDFTGGGTEANQLIAIREYIVWTDAAPTAATLAADFMAQVNLDPSGDVNATVVSDKLRLTLDSVTEGDFFPSVESGMTETEITPFVAPAGTPAIVEALAPTMSSPTATYTTWTINYKHYYKHNGVGGMESRKDEYVLVFADTGATNYAAFAAEIAAVLGGTATPVAGYLGM